MEKSDTGSSVFDKESPWRLLVKLGGPSVLTTVVMLLYNLADVFFVGQTNDSMQVAAVSLCAPVFTVLSALGMLFGNGGCIRSAALLGAGRRDDVRAVSAFCFWGGLSVSLLLSCALLLFMPRILTLLGASEQTLPYARGYLTIMAAGFPLMLTCQSMSSLLRADGHAKEPMLGHLIGSLSNMVLDPILILGLGMGVRGAALATVLANALNALWLVRLLYRKRDVFSVRLRPHTFTWELTGGTLLLGVPIMVSTLLTSFSGVLNNHFLAGYGDLLLAANGISSKLRMIITMLVMGMSMGIQPAVSYYHGGGQHDRLKSILRVTALATTAVGILLSVLFFLFRAELIAVFLKDGEVIRYGTQMIWSAILIGPVQGIFQLCVCYLQGTGSVALSTGFAVFREAVHILLLVGMHAAFGFMGLILSAPVTLYLCVLMGVGLCVWQTKHAQKKEMRLQKREA